MTMTKNAVGNLIARYKTVLQNCSLLNTFGSLAAATVLAGAMVLGGASGALAEDVEASFSGAYDDDYFAADASNVSGTENTITLNVDEANFSGFWAELSGGAKVSNGEVYSLGGATLNITSSTMDCDVYGGNKVYTGGVSYIGSIAVNADSISQNTIFDNLYGGSYVQGTATTDTITLNLKNSTFGQTCGGDYMWGTSSTIGSIVINAQSGAYFTGELLGGAYLKSGSSEIGSITIDFTGASMASGEGLYGGSFIYSSDTPSHIGEISMTVGEGSTIAGGLWGGSLTGSSATNSISAIDSVSILIEGGTVTTYNDIFVGGNISKSGAYETVTSGELTITGGTIKADVCGGGRATSGTTEVISTVVHIAGGSFTGSIYAGGESDNDSYSIVQDALVIFSGDQTTAEAGTTGAYLANGYDGLKVYGTGINYATVVNSTFAFGSDSTVYTGEFNGTISGFNTIVVNAGSDVTMTDLTLSGTDFTIATGASITLDTLTLTGDSTQTISTGQLVITDSASFGDADNGVLTVGTLTLTDSAIVALYDEEYTMDDLTTTQDALAEITEGSDAFTLRFMGTLVDDSGVAEDLTAAAGTDGEIQATEDSVFSDDGTTFATGNTLSVDASGAEDASSLTSSEDGLGTVKDVAVNNVDDSVDSVDLTVKGESWLVGDGTGALLSATDTDGNAVDTKITVADGGTLNVGITDNLNAQGGSLESVTVGESEGTGDDATFNVNTASATIGTLTAYENAKINVLNSSVVAEKFESAEGSVLYIDPAYMQITDATNATFGGTVLVSDGSVFALGDSDIAYWQELVEAAGLTSTSLDTGFTVSVGQSAVIISGVAIDISGTGSLIVDADVDADGEIDGISMIAAGTAYFGDDSLCIIDMSTWSDSDAALTATTITTVEGAKLLVTTAGATLAEDAEGDYSATILIASGTTTDMAEGAWGDGAEDAIDTDTIFLDNAFMEVTEVTKEDSSYSITVGQVSASDALGTKLDSGLAALIDNAIASGLDSAGMDFIKDASNQENGGTIIEGATKLAANAAVVPGLNSVNAAAVANMGARTSIVPQAKATAQSETSNWLAMNGDGAILPTADGGNMAQGFGIWFMPMYNHTSADGFKSGKYNYGYDTDIVGATLGADYTFASDLRLGLAFNVGQGSSTSTGDFATTENDFDYAGISVYGAKHFDALGLSFDMGYTVSENDMVQDASGGDLYGDADASLFTMGVKAEYLIPLDSFNVTPYAGIRFNYYDVDAYDTKQNGSDIFSTASGDNTVWEIPVGVTFDTTTKVGSWDFTPSLGLGVKFAMGDLDADQEVSIAGDPSSVVLSSEVADEVTFQGALGLGFAKDNCTIGLNYTLDLSENVESHGVSVNLRYEF